MYYFSVVVGRKIDLAHIYSVADASLKKTISVESKVKAYFISFLSKFFGLLFLAENGNSSYCLFGKCYYCKEDESVCGDENNNIDGVILLVVPGTLAKYRSPWQRTYKDDQKADWEINADYCKLVCIIY